jgi:hypothetical protein
MREQFVEAGTRDIDIDCVYPPQFIPLSQESTTNMMQSESLQYFSHDSLNLLCPPRSHIFICIFPESQQPLTFLNLAMVEADRRNGVLFELAGCDGADECGLTGVLQADDAQLELLVEEEGAQPVHHLIEQGLHDGGEVINYTGT